MRKLWGLEDDEEFGAGQGWSAEEQRLLDEAGEREALREALRKEEKRERMINWEKYEWEEQPAEIGEEEGEQPKYRSTEPRPSKK